MDRSKVFRKTAEGEEAVRQRTRLVQRNLRNILIMVDGHATVADLARRFGDENATLSALTELQAGGFVVEVAASNTLDFTAAGSDEAVDRNVPVLTATVVVPPPPTAAAEPRPSVQLQPESIEEIELPEPEDEPLPPPILPVAASGRKQQAVAAGPGWRDRIKAVFARGAKAHAGEMKKPDDGEPQTASPLELAPLRRSGAKLYVGWPLLALFAIVAIAVLPALTLLLYPYGRHLPNIERKASAMLQDPVKIGGIGFSFLPRPHIALRDIAVGKEAHLIVAEVRAVPNFLSLLGSKQVIHELAVDNAAVKDAGLVRLAQIGAGDASLEIRHITLTGMSLMAGGALIGGIGGEVRISADGSPETIALRNAEGTLKLELQPQGEGYRIVASAGNWKALSKPELTFQWLDARGELRPSRLELTKIDGKAFDGLIEGKATLDWADKAVFSGDFDLKRMSASRLLSGIGSDLTVEGELSARLRIEAAAQTPAGLTEATRGEGSFEVKRGAVKGFDLAEAVRGRAPTRGGETRFEQLTGTFQYDAGERRLGNLRLASGQLKAGGHLGIAGDARLSGVADVELKSSAMTLRMPLTIGGTAKEPLLTPPRAR
jgi:hypothetical protein